MAKQRDRKTTPRRPRRDDDLPGLDGLTLAKLREMARREGVDVRGLRRKRQVIDRLRSEGLRRFQWRKVPPPISKDADPPDPSDPWSMLDYMARWGPHDAHKLTHFPREQRAAVLSLLELLIGDGLVRAIPEPWSSDRRDEGEVVFMLTEEGWARVHRQAVRDARAAATAAHIITAAVAAKRYYVSAPTLSKAVLAGNLTDHRPSDRRKTKSPLLLDEREIAARYRIRK